ncbi:hypothetical protein [Pedobacter frigoris]|uniref:hypothetical protein n=1 Tax=Pedobacter frigoris TaxID=2571272 RepID=UPI00292D0426|nr:hypothetical protein [Pedobacter frigoris]
MDMKINSFVASIHLLGVKEKLLVPDRFLIPSNPMELNADYEVLPKAQQNLWYFGSLASFE